MIKDRNGIYVYPFHKTEGSEFHEKRDRPALLRELNDDILHQINWETPFYINFLEECLKGFDLTGKTCLDLGSGDGRFTTYLISKGVKNIICVDSDYKTLHSLSVFSEKENFKDKITLINCSAHDLPIDDESIDVVLALGVFYYLGEFHKIGIKNVFDKLVKGGMLISSEPCKEGIAMRSLIFEGLNQMFDTIFKGEFYEKQGDIKGKFFLHDQDELLSMYQDSGFNLEKRKGLSIFHQIVRILYVKGSITKNDLESNLQNLSRVFDYLDKNGTFDKTHLFHHVK